jgi:RHS repeat-associated protein
LSTTQYINGFQYFDNVLQFFPTPEGYVKNTPMLSGGYSFDYVYNYTDHLGNIRLSYTQDPQTGALAILEEQHYYPFGLQHKNYNSDITKIDREEELKTLKEAAPPSVPLQNPGYAYKYNGKELQNEFGVEMYDFGARNYDPALGRWMNVDPLAEMMRRHSPYNYAFDNPVFFIDADGMMPFGSIDGSETSNNESFSNDEFSRRMRMKSEKDYSNHNNNSHYKSNGKDKSPSSNCPEGSCNDNPIVLPEIVVTAKGKGHKLEAMGISGEAMSFSGAMPSWMKQMELTSYYNTIYKPEFDAMIRDMSAARRPFAIGFLAVLAAPVAIEAAPFLYVGAQSGYASAFSSYRYAFSFGNTVYYNINTWGSAAASAGASLSYRYGSQITNSLTGYKGVQSFVTKYNINIDIAGPIGNYIYAKFSKASPIDRPFSN